MAKSKGEAYKEYQESDLKENFAGMSGNRLVYQTRGSRDQWKNIETDTTVRDYFSLQDYYYFRPNEQVADKPKDIITQCVDAYRKVGLLRNVIDLMSDFGSQGIKLVHPNPTIQKFYRDWFEKVGGPDRSERFLNNLYKAGNVVIRRTNVKITKKASKDMNAYAATEPDKLEKREKIQKKVIPWRYTFLLPQMVEAVGGELGQFVGKTKYALKIPLHLFNIIKHPSSDLEKQLVSRIPAEIKNAIIKGDGLLPLSDDDIVVKFYKKDDWQVWADPMLYSIIDDVIMLEKLKLADKAALDGVISQVRLWRLGSLDHELFPNESSINKLVNVLSSNPGGGPFDIIWGPELEFDETSTEAYKFLGPQKYEPTLNDIHAGLGVPSTLTGAGTKTGFTNNFISLKTLVKRLEYGRSVLTSWWNEEIYRVQKAMGFKQPAEVRYDRMILTDEAAEKALLLDMWDRNLITDETVLERFGEDATMELLISRRENKERESKKRMPKGGPHHISDKEHEIAKLAVGRGYVKPNQAGMDVEHSYEKEPFIEQLDMKSKTGPTPQDSPSGDKGRPNNSKDSKPRNRTVKPRTSAEKLLWAREAQQKIADILNPLLLSYFNKNNMRSLSASEFKYCEKAKFIVLSRMEPYQDITKECVVKACENLKLSIDFAELYDNYIKNKDMGVDDVRLCQAMIFAELK